MKIFLATILLLINIVARAQVSFSETFSDIEDVLTHKNLQKDKEISLETSRLEDLINENFCPNHFETHDSCQGFQGASTPEELNTDGWKVLFEVKYRPMEERITNFTSQVKYTPISFNSYRRITNNSEHDISNSKELENEAFRIFKWMNENSISKPSMESIKTQLIIDQLSNPLFNQNDSHMMAKLSEYSRSLNDEEYTRLITTLADYVGYNKERSQFIQTPQAGKGTVTPFQQMLGTKNGICGDIHSMVATLGEIRGWEAFTVGYAVKGTQHIVTALANPKEPNKLMIVNYGRYEEHTLNNGNSFTPAPTSNGWEEIGTQLRIFKNNKNKMQQIATIPTALGSFMNDLFKKDYHAQKAMPGNENYNIKKVEFSKTKQKDGKELSKEFAIYEGQTDNAHIYGIAVSKETFKNLYKWDDKAGKCVLKKSKYFSYGVAANLIDLKQADFDNTFYAYLNIKGGQIIHVYQSDVIQFKGIIGYEIDGFNSIDDGSFLAADGNVTTLLGLAGDYQTNGSSAHIGMNFESVIGLRNQNLMTDLGSLPENLNPVTFNAVSINASAKKSLNDIQLLTDNSIRMSRVGNQILLSTGVIHKNTTILAQYQGSLKAFPIGNTLSEVNLLQNFNNSDGVRLGLKQEFSNKKKTFSGAASANIGVTTTTPDPKLFGGVGVKINLNGKKKK